MNLLSTRIIDGSDGRSESTDLIERHEQRIARLEASVLPHTLITRYSQIVTHDLVLNAERRGHGIPYLTGCLAD